MSTYTISINLTYPSTIYIHLSISIYIYFYLYISIYYSILSIYIYLFEEAVWSGSKGDDCMSTYKVDQKERTNKFIMTFSQKKIPFICCLPKYRVCVLCTLVFDSIYKTAFVVRPSFINLYTYDRTNLYRRNVFE